MGEQARMNEAQEESEENQRQKPKTEDGLQLNQQALIMCLQKASLTTSDNTRDEAYVQTGSPEQCVVKFQESRVTRGKNTVNLRTYGGTHHLGASVDLSTTCKSAREISKLWRERSKTGSDGLQRDHLQLQR